MDVRINRAKSKFRGNGQILDFAHIYMFGRAIDPMYRGVIGLFKFFIFFEKIEKNDFSLQRPHFGGKILPNFQSLALLWNTRITT